MQLVAYGAQDIYLTGNPVITYFKVVYRRHTNFAMECIEQSFNGSVDFSRRVKAIISRNGDLVSGMHVKITLPHIQTAAGGAATRWTDCVGHCILNTIEIEIGGQLIDRHFSDWLEIWSQLTVPASKLGAYFELIGLDGDVGLQTPTLAADPVGTIVGPGALLDAAGNRILYVPLQFWFCRNVGLSLPLIALQYHEVTVSIEIEAFSKLQIGGAVIRPGESLKMSLWVDYIYLDTDERRRFAQVSHEYLIEQLQSSDNLYESDNISIKLNINHPVKELIWVARHDSHATLNQWNNYSNSIAANNQYFGRPKPDPANDPFTVFGLDLNAYRRALSSNMIQSALLQINGHERFARQEGVYFSRMQPMMYHTSVPPSIGINVYSFSMKPEVHQPSGTCNFSRIDNAVLNIKLNPIKSVVNTGDGLNAQQNPGAAAANLPDNTTTGVVKVYAVNYNVLRIMSGMGGLAYSN